MDYNQLDNQLCSLYKDLKARRLELKLKEEVSTESECLTRMMKAISNAIDETNQLL